MRRAAFIVSLLVPVGCGGVEEIATERHALVTAQTWRLQTNHEDPLAAHRDGRVECDDGAWHVNLNGIEVDTGACNYASLTQPLRVEVRRGDPILFRLWWQRLASIEPASAHLAILIGQDLVWEESVPIPGRAEIREEAVVSPVDAPAGAPVTFHLHNHGNNTWQLDDLSVIKGVKR